jgi:hypothetical protein
MPFKSEKQRRWMWANEPEMAEKWEEEEEKNEGNRMRITKRQLRRIIQEAMLCEQSGERIVTFTTGDYSDEGGPGGDSSELVIRDDEEHPDGGTWGEIVDDDLADELYHAGELPGPPETYDIKRR